MNKNQLENLIIKPSLDDLCNDFEDDKRINCPSATKLLLLTTAPESELGHYIKQVGGKALSPYMIEPKTFKWLYSKQKDDPFLLFTKDTSFSWLMGNIVYSTCIARLIYWYKTADPLPSIDDNEGFWKYYKKHWNTEKGKTTKAVFFNKAEHYGII